MSLRDYIVKNKERVSLTQLLLQNEISRLRVWANVTADPIKEMPSSIRTSAEGNTSSVRDFDPDCQSCLMYLLT
jgi:hypothetical protein